MSFTNAATRTAPGSSAGAATLLAGVRDVLASARAIRLTDYEECQGDALRPLVDSVRAVIDAATAVLTQAASSEDPQGVSALAPVDGNLCREVDRRMIDPASAAKIAGLAFIARFALKSHVASLRVVNLAGEPWEVISTCGGAVREVLKSLSALELTVCEVEGVTPVTDFYLSELERSLRVRHAYACFRADLLRAGPPDPSTLQRRLRMAASAIAKLVGREIYPSARVHDRWMIRQFQKRIREWMQLHAEQSARADVLTVSGVRLWEELANIAELVMQVNHRAELRAHDGEVLDAAIAKAEGGGFGPEDLAAVARLWGRDPQLDPMIEARSPSDDPAWLDALRQARERLGRAAPSPPSTHPGPRTFSPSTESF